jgi:putative endonuclease
VGTLPKRRAAAARERQIEERVTRLYEKRIDGAAAEQLALKHLARAGLSLIARNYRSPFGEIDLIVDHDGVVAFVEVRSRAREDYGTAAESVDGRKRSRLRATAEHFLQHDKRASNRPCRFDIVTVTRSPEGERIEWLRNAFE